MTLSGATLPILPNIALKDYSGTSNNTKLVHWPLMDGLLHLVQRGGAWAAAARQSLYCYIMVRFSVVLMWRLKG